MCRIIFIIFGSFLFCTKILSQDALEIVRRSEDRAKGKTSVAEMSIQTIRPEWKRDLKLKTWTLGNDFVVILIQSPIKERGIAFLKRKKEIWNWVPSIERSIKLPPSMMSQSWMGTDFTNDDLVKESSTVQDYRHSMTKDTQIMGRSCYQIRLDPKPEAAVIWGKILLCIDKKDYLLMKAEYFDEDNQLVNTMNTTEIGMLGGRILPLRIELIPRDKKGHKTIMEYHKIIFDKPIAEKFFSVQQLSKLK
ncbi:MAG: outer membrane lipoprotein-sorting protein [Saprospiraceae bacterium]|nr:outer membrane lipoprotein-sorting protein [Candidatus Vicinibacter affinis]MBP6172927.1 outer membrane lipoprotein-sorting protein [Saprospiraceae bacterium]MBK6571714.1 outer membrane lipoprotein-sorting protein [Candidatus Vicinibacter affinis]MBK7302560.1 outer membrane lipoprotein-sorting protein [Candidatus Vicinibacter affinis]MBK7798490.1 outer membrane lipoprotein-sorting protein [Candidatus Vicinibacter affinis]